MVKKVLMATMSLGIGGAETHIVELSLELARRGMEVHVASNGGVYVDDLGAAGIKHHTVPLDQRSLRCMIKSFFLLLKLIKREKPDVIHAHARIPGFICGILNKFTGVDVVTTAHFDFNVSGGLRYLTNWGKKVIAVSEDIKDYLVKNYKVKNDDILVSVNGIDTEKFSCAVSPDDVIEELKLDKSYPVICNVSRLDENAALVSRLLIEIAPELHARFNGVQIIIAGGGNIYDELKEKADKVNRATGVNTVTLTGPRTDIPAVLNACDLFVGVSRAALEALSCTKPAVIAGNEGYIGLFTREKLNTAINTNFTCRGCNAATGESLFREITSFFDDYTQEKAAELAEYGRRVVVRDYSVSRMTDDCITAYNAAFNYEYNVLLSGYYGFKNAGDEAILQSIHNSLKKAGNDISITVMSYDPKDTIDRYGYNAVDRFNLLSVYKALHRCDVLVYGGGSLLQDVTSTRSLLYYTLVINAAKIMGKKVMIYANGIGPVKKESNRRRVKRVIGKADVISLRDAASAVTLRAMGITRDDIKLTADPVFTLCGKSLDESLLRLSEYGVPDAPFIIVSIRSWPDIGSFCEKLAAVCDRVYTDLGRNIVFISMQSDKDISISRHVSGLMKRPSYVLENRFMADELMGIIGASDLVLSMRLHALIFAARMNIPFASMVYDPKVLAITEMLAMPSAGNVADFDPEQVFSAISDVFNNRDEYARVLSEKSKQLEHAAGADVVYLLKLLKGE